MTKLFLIIIVAITIRLLPFGVPPSLNWDEVSHAYTAYSLLHTGSDQWSQKLPVLNFRAYGDYPTTLNVYLTAGLFSLFGDSDFTARLPHLVYGLLYVLVMYVLASSVFKSTKVGLFIALLAAVEPWLVFPARAVFQSNLALLLFTLGLTLFVRTRQIWSFVFFILSLFAYHTTRIVVPIFALAFFGQKKFIMGMLLILIPISFILHPNSQARGRWVGILNPNTIYAIEYARNTSNLGPSMAKLIHNRPVYLLTTITRNLTDYFSPHFLVLSGGSQSQFSQPGFGLFSPGAYLLIVVGAFFALKKHKILFVIICISLIPAILTVDRFAVIRSTLSLPFWLILAGIGFVKIKNNQKPLVILSTLSLLWLGTYYFKLFTNYSIQYAGAWQYGYRQVVAELTTRHQQYDQILFTKRYGEPHEFHWWYTRTLQPNYLWDYHDNWYWVNKFENITFVNDWEMLVTAGQTQYKGTTLVIASPDHVPVGKIIHTVKNPDSSPAFILVEI